MPSLTACLKSAGSYLSAEDKSAILEAARKYRKTMSALEAGRRAVDDQIAAVQALLDAAPAKAEPAEPADPRLQDAEMRSQLEASKADVGWQQIGGRILRDQRTAIDPNAPDAVYSGDVVGRTQWLGSDLWRDRPKEGGRVTEQEASDAIDKALRGEPMSARQRRFVAYTLDSIEDRMSAAEKAALEALDEALIEAQESRDEDPVDAFWSSLAEVEAQEERDAIQAQDDAEDAGGNGAAAGAAGRVAQEGAGGAQAAQREAGEEGLTLEAQTPEALREKAEREQAATDRERKQRAAEQERLRRQAEDRDVRARADATVDDFQLGQSADQQMSGMGDMFADAEPAAPAPVEAAAPKTAPMPTVATIPLNAAQDAHRWTSHVPEQRAVQEQQSFRSALSDAWDRAASIAGQDAAAIDRITEVFADVADGYRDRYMATLGAKSRTASAMITGPAKFPTERNRKRLETERKRAEEAEQYLQRGIKRLIRAARGPIDNSPESELERVRLNLSQREEAQEQMKAANAALRKGDDEALADLGFSEEQIAKLKTPDFAGRPGFPDYKLANNNAEIRRLRERLASAEARVQEAADGPTKTTFAGVRIEENAQDDRIRLFFDGKPNEAVREDLKANGFKWSPNAGAWQRQLTDNARAAAQRVLNLHFKDDAGNVAKFSRATPATKAEQEALRVVSETDALFALKKSFADTIAGVAADIDKSIKVTPHEAEGLSSYTLTMPDGQTAEIFVREASPYGPHTFDNTYSDDNELTEARTVRPGVNPEAVEADVGDVWINVSRLKPGSGGSKIYAIAGDFAHNTGRIFIGDPNGLSEEAIRRRPEAMLASALRWGTTSHLGPGKQQVRGSADIGVPPLEWRYGDDLGNIRRLIDLNLKALENGGLDDSSVSFDAATGEFRDTDGQPLSRADIDALAAATDLGDRALAGGRTIARGAVFRALLREESAGGEGQGRRDGLLARLAKLGSDAAPAVGGLFKRGAAPAGLTLEQAQAFAKALKAAGVDNVNVVQSVDDMPNAKRESVLRSEPDGQVRGAFFRDDGSVWLVADHIRSPDEFAFVVNHELFHRGLAKTLGPEAKALLRRMYLTNGALNRAAKAQMAKHGISEDEAIEEALADMAGEGKARDLRGWDKLLKMIRDYLGKIGTALGVEMTWTDDMVEDFVAAIKREGLTDGVHVDAGAAQETMLSRATPAWVESGSADLQSAASKIDTYAPTKPLKDKLREMASGWQDKLVQGMLDAYAPLKNLSMDAYIAARMTKSADGAFEGMLMHGKPKMAADGSITGDLDGKGFLGFMQELKGEHDRFFMWLAGNRAARLMGEDKEHLFTAAEIKAMTALNGGQMPDGKSRAIAYKKAHEQFNAYSKSVLDVAEKAGLIDAESRKVWEHDFYVPFYRMSQDAEISGPGKIKGLVRQKAFERLKGGKENLGDLMANTLQNWSHLLSASLANVAAAKSLQAAEAAGIALEAKESVAKEMAKAAGLKGNAVYYMDQGLQRWYVVEDPAVLQAVSALEAPALSGLALQIMGKFKKYLTIGVTVSPAFKIRNLIRDTLAAPAANEMSFNVARNLAEGWRGTDTKSNAYAEMLFGGALMKFGTYLEGDRAEHVKRLIADGVDDKTILNTPQKVKAALGKVWDAWQGFGDRLENVNRTALYQQLVDSGVSPRDAAFQARDMMDFSLQGSWAAMRTLTAIVPFMNARLQGLYKLGRAANEDPKRMGYMVGAVSLASIALMLAQQDDDDWKAREDWDRDTYWWIKVGDTAFRIPKPFEVGAMGTIAERSVELMVNDEMTGKRFAERMKQMLLDTFAMNPVPQLFKPGIDLYANKDSFTGRQIETLGMERLSKPERYGPNTSALAKALGSAGDYTGLSPVQIDHVIRAYFGWLGVQASTTVDVIVSPASDVAKPAARLDDFAGGFVKELPAASSRYLEEFYKQAKITSQAMADLKRARESGDMEKAAEIMADKGDRIAQYRIYQQAERQLSDINKRIRMVRESRALDAGTKREQLDSLAAMRNRMAKIISDRTRTLEAAR